MNVGNNIKQLDFKMPQLYGITTSYRFVDWPDLLKLWQIMLVIYYSNKVKGHSVSNKT